jgi:signal transduction histidine kinase
VRRIERVMDRLSRLAALRPAERRPVDVSAFIEELLERQRERIERRRLVVLEELDQRNGVCLGDEQQLRFALEALIDKSLELVPDRGDVYVAAKHHPEGLRGSPSLRVLIRFQSPESPSSGAAGEPSPSEMALDILLAEAIVRAAGGFLTLSDAGGRETLIVLDLPAPPRS